MPISNFLGAGRYGFKTDQRPRPARAPSGPENQRRYAAALKGIGRRTILCTLLIDDQGNITPDSVAACPRLGLTAPPKPATKITVPPEGKPIPPPPGFAPERHPEYLTGQLVQFLGIGPNSRDDFMDPIGRPCYLDHIVFEIDAPDPSSQNLQPMIRMGTDNVDGPIVGDISPWTQQQDVGTLTGLFSTANRATALTLTFHYPILFTPFRPHLRAINNSGGFGFQVSSHWVFRVIQPEEIKFIATPTLTQAQAVSGLSNYAFPPSQVCLKPVSGGPCIPGGKMGALEIVAQQLRESPFGMTQFQILNLMNTYGLPASAFNLVKIQSTKPPNIELLLKAAK